MQTTHIADLGTTVRQAPRDTQTHDTACHAKVAGLYS